MKTNHADLARGITNWEPNRTLEEALQHARHLDADFPASQLSQFQQQMVALGREVDHLRSVANRLSETDPNHDK